MYESTDLENSYFTALRILSTFLFQLYFMLITIAGILTLLLAIHDVFVTIVTSNYS